MTDQLAARRHLAYRYLLKKCLRLSAHHRMQLSAFWNCTTAQLRRVGFRSAPTDVVDQLITSYAVKDFIDVQGVPGFYTANIKLETGETATTWKLNTPPRNSILRPFKDKHGLIQGILVYRTVRDHEPFLLSSNGLANGTKAVNFNPMIHT